MAFRTSPGSGATSTLAVVTHVWKILTAAATVFLLAMAGLLFVLADRNQTFLATGDHITGVVTQTSTASRLCEDPWQRTRRRACTVAAITYHDEGHDGILLSPPLSNGQLSQGDRVNLVIDRQGHDVDDDIVALDKPLGIKYRMVPWLFVAAAVGVAGWGVRFQKRPPT